MKYYDITIDGDEFIVGSYRLTSIEAALRQARHQAELDRRLHEK